MTELSETKWGRRFRLPSGSSEAVLGGNLLNKAGVLLVTIGLALAIGYSMTSLGPAGRIALGAIASASMLGAGLYAERRENYKIFGRGLIGGGWAGFYFTAFAAYAIPAARVIASPAAGTILLGLVSAAMIAHSLRYKSETVTGMAYLLSFVTLAISGVPMLAMIATVPLAASVVYIACRFGWTSLITAGLPVAYGVFYLQSQFAGVAEANLLRVLLVTYWVVFETAEILRPSGSRVPLALNAICFSSLAWGSPVLAACAYAASTAMRLVCNREYRWSLTALSILCASAIFQHLSGLAVAIALLIEAEALFLAGAYFRREFVRMLAGCAFAIAFWQLGIAAFDNRTPWPPVAATTAVAMYLNRYLHRESWPYSWAGTALAAIVLAKETPVEWWGVAWLVLAGLVSEIHKRTGAVEFRLQSAVTGVTAVIALGLCIVFEMNPWQPQLTAAILLFAGAMRSSFAAPAAAAGTAISSALLWNVLPALLVALGWGALGLALFEAGAFTNQIWIRRQGEAMALAAFGRIFFVNLDLATVAPVVGLQYYLHARGQRWFVYTGTIAAATLIRFEAGRVLTVIGWSAMALACQYLGTKRLNRDLRIQAFVLAGAAFVRCWTTNFNEPDIVSRAAVGGLVIALLYSAHLVSRRDMETFARPLFCTLASGLLSVLLFHEVSGKLLTMAWAVQGAVLLAAGFGLRERHVRLTGLALLAACTAKLFFYDFAALDTPHRIASFIVLGLLLIGGSWVYTRFRKQIEGDL